MPAGTSAGFKPERFKAITVEIADHVCWVVLDRPEALNAFDDRMRQEVRATWRALREIDEVRVAVLTARGDRAFCAGIDRGAEMTALGGGNLYGTSNNYMYDDPGDDLGPKACDLWKPVIAAVNGICVGGGFEIALSCDLLLAADTARFALPEIRAGTIADAGTGTAGFGDGDVLQAAVCRDDECGFAVDGVHRQARR